MTEAPASVPNLRRGGSGRRRAGLPSPMDAHSVLWAPRLPCSPRPHTGALGLTHRTGEGGGFTPSFTRRSFERFLFILVAKGGSEGPVPAGAWPSPTSHLIPLFYFPSEIHKRIQKLPLKREKPRIAKAGFKNITNVGVLDDQV